MKAGLAAVSRDSKGLNLGVYSLTEDHVNGVFNAEGIAVWLGLKLASELGIDNVILETDNTIVYEFLIRYNQCHKVQGSWFHDVLAIAKQFKESLFLVIRHETNTLADYIAAKALRQDFCWSNLRSVPLCITECILGL